MPHGGHGGCPGRARCESAADQARRLAEEATAAVADARAKLADAERGESETRAPLEAAEREEQRLSAEAKR